MRSCAPEGRPDADLRLRIVWAGSHICHGHGFHLGLLDVTTFLGIGGLFVSVFSRLLARHALIPVKDPRLPESLAFENM